MPPIITRHAKEQNSRNGFGIQFLRKIANLASKSGDSVLSSRTSVGTAQNGGWHFLSWHPVRRNLLDYWKRMWFDKRASIGVLRVGLMPALASLRCMPLGLFPDKPAPGLYDRILRTVQELLGHTRVRTTMIYTHVLNRGGHAVRCCNNIGSYSAPKSEGSQLMKTKFTYWKEPDGRYVGYLNSHPDHWTQGDNLDDLKEHLRDLYQMFSAEDIPGIRKVEELEVP